MKKLFTVLLAGLLVMGMTSFAMADVDVRTDVEKCWDADVDVEVNINKNILLVVKQIEQVDTSAEADVTKNDLIEDVDLDLSATAAQAQLLNNAFTDAVGIISVNQAPGYANNQGNGIAIAYASVIDPALDAFLNASAHVEKDIDGEIEIETEDVVVMDNTITNNALMNAVGVISVNQAAGNANNQDNAVAMAIGTDPVASLAEADLGLDIDDVDIDIDTCATIDVVSESGFQFATGVISLNQASGSANNQANCLAITVASFGGPF